MSSRRLGSVVFGLCVVAACQGASESDLFDPNAPLDVEAGAGNDATTSSSASSSGAPTSSGAPSSSSGSAGAPDATPDAPAADPDPSGVFCSDALGYCAGASPLCCAGRPASGALGPYACKDACLGTETTIDCDDSDDCAAGEVCCNTNAGGVPQAVVCKPAAECPPTASQTIACDPAKPDTCNGYNGTAAVPPGAAVTSCKPHVNMAPGFAICIP